MGLFSKFLGKELGEEQAKKLDDAGAQILGKLFSGEVNAREAAKPAAQQTPQRPAVSEEPSFYDEIPAEENSFSFKGPYQEYFRKVFSEEFPAYRITEAPMPHGNGTVFSFMQGSNQALVVEVMSENCSSQKLRRECERIGIPYLRYYHDHWGWWNTRSYVRDRTRRALGM